MHKGQETRSPPASFISKIVRRVYPPRHLAFYGQRLVLEPSVRRGISKILARSLPRAVATADDEQVIGRVSGELDRDGLSFLPQIITRKQIGDILEYTASKPCYDRFHPRQGTFDIANAPASCHVAAFRDPDILRCPHLLKIANHPIVLASVARLFGCKPTISNISLWWSLSGRKDPEDAELFHRDVDEWHFVKLFIYLTDVDEDAGPHVFVKGSHRIRHLMLVRRYQDEEVTDAFGADRVTVLTGAAGTAFIENTFGMHKGQMARHRNRLLFQVQYSLFPIGIYQYSPARRGPEHAQYDPYVNRLYFT